MFWGCGSCRSIFELLELWERLLEGCSGGVCMVVIMGVGFFGVFIVILVISFLLERNIGVNKLVCMMILLKILCYGFILFLFKFF